MATREKKPQLSATSAQRPRPRAGRRAPRAKGAGGNWNAWRPYLPTLLISVLCVVTLVVLVVMYYVITSSAFFQAHDVIVSGNKRTTIDEIRGVVQKQTAASGVWHADLESVRTEVKRLPWVQEATVARVLPDGVRVQVTEREKAGVFLAGNNKLMWVDAEGVQLGPYTAADKVAHLVVIKGLDEGNTPAARTNNAQRLRMYQEIVTQWNAKGLTKYVSDVDLAHLSDVRAELRSLPGVPIMLGDRNWSQRLTDVLQALRGETAVESVDAKLDGNVIVAASDKTAKPTSKPEKTPDAGNRARPAR